MKSATLLLFLFFSYRLLGQDAQTIYFRDLYGMEKFDEITKDFDGKIHVLYWDGLLHEKQ